jgi:hypothetical protein
VVPIDKESFATGQRMNPDYRMLSCGMPRQHFFNVIRTQPDLSHTLQRLADIVDGGEAVKKGLHRGGERRVGRVHARETGVAALDGEAH